MAPKTKGAATAPASRKVSKPPAPAKKKAVTKKAVAKKAVAKKALKRPAANKAPAKKPPAGKKAPIKKPPAGKKAPTKKVAAAKKLPVKKAAVKKAAAKKVPAKKAVVANPPVKKAVVTNAPPAPPMPAQPRSSTRSRGGIPALAKRVPHASDRKAPPKRKGPLDKFLLGQLAALNEERITYARQAASLKAEADLLMAEREPGDVQFDEESGEGDTIAVERERDLTLSASAQAAVEDIDRAIAKLHDGTYGVCEQCYANIPKERLRALPYAALCVQCKSAGFSRR